MIEDLAAFFGDFGVLATYGTQTATVLFDQPGDTGMLAGRMVSVGYAIRYKVGDLVGLKRGDSVVIAGVTYKVNEVLPVHDGATFTANLQKP